MPSPRNSSRNKRRSDFADLEYRANIAPLTVSGRLMSANTGRSVLVKVRSKRFGFLGREGVLCFGGELHGSGILPPMSDDSFPFRHQLVVRFSDCDPMGHANHAAYFTYFEQCRLTWWRHLGSTTGPPGASAVIVHAECDYRAPALADDQLEVRLTLGGSDTRA